MSIWGQVVLALPLCLASLLTGVIWCIWITGLAKKYSGKGLVKRPLLALAMPPALFLPLVTILFIAVFRVPNGAGLVVSATIVVFAGCAAYLVVQGIRHPEWRGW